MNQVAETQDKAKQATGTPTAVAPKDISNGVTRPRLGSLTARVWTICDEQSAAANAPAERAKVIEQATAEGINPATVATQHGKWRKYHGLVADTPEAKAEKAAVVAKVKVEKEAAAKAKKEAAAKAKAEKAAAKAAVAKAPEVATNPVASDAEGDIFVEDGTDAGVAE